MKFLMKYALIATVALILAGCYNSYQYLDPEWTQKPARMKILFTKPMITDEEKIPYTMAPIEDWFGGKIDNVLQFNSNVPCVVEKVSKKELSYETQKMGSLDVQLPKVESMSDSFDVYLIFDHITLNLSAVVSTLPGGAGIVAPAIGGSTLATQAVGAFAGMTFNFKGESTEIDANYALYDVKTGKRLAYGHLEERMFHEEVAMEQGWYDNIRQMVLRIFGKTPVTRF